MRRITGLILGALLTASASADLLIWQVSNGDGTLAQVLNEGGGSYAYAKILAYNGGDVITMNSYFSPNSTLKLEGAVDSENLADSRTLYADLSELSGSSYSAYSFAVEIYGSDDAVIGSVGWSSADALSSYITSKSDFESSWTRLNTGFGSAGWKSGAAPEPTSGILVLLGAAMLGLRRMKVA